LAHQGARIIGTDTLRISVVLQVSGDDQEREQGSEDNPNINAHQSSQAALASFGPYYYLGEQVRAGTAGALFFDHHVSPHRRNF
jgi:hypothetical protein